MTQPSGQKQYEAPTQVITSAGLVILNPAAGKGRPEKIREVLQSFLSVDAYDLHETSEDEDLREVVQTAVQSKAYSWVAAVGGDGTVSQVADGLAGSEVPLAIIPAGTGNVLAQALGIPQDTESACQLLLDNEKEVRQIDSVRIEQDHYFLQLGIGLESATMENTSSRQKNRWGMAAYIWTLIKEAFGWQPYRFDLTVDGQSHSLQASELVIANAGKIGLANLEWGEAIEPDDGQIDIVVVKARSLLDYLRVLASLVRGEQRKSNHVQQFKARKKIELAAEKALPIHGDGEVLDLALPLTAVVEPQSLNVIVPPAQSRGEK